MDIQNCSGIAESLQKIVDWQRLEGIRTDHLDDMTDVCKTYKVTDVSQAVEAMTQLRSKTNISQNILVMEECSELIKELVKSMRGKGTIEAVFDEACDVLASIFCLLHECGASEEMVKEQILFKYNRAIERFRDNGYF